jgi:hypothetical protein
MKRKNYEESAAKKRKSIDFGKGVRGKYAGMKLVIVGAVPNSEKKRLADSGADAVLKRVSRVLKSAGPMKRDLEAAINQACDLIESARNT